MKHDSIILIGMPGCGKSTLGVILAKNLGFDFIDTDLLIQKQKKMKLHEIIEKYGIDEFIRIENEIISAVIAESSVIATGGSAVYGDAAMERMREIGTVVYLKLPADEIARRVSDFEARGVVAKHGQSIFDIYNERVPLYQKYADITVDLIDLSIESGVSAVINNINSKEGFLHEI